MPDVLALGSDSLHTFTPRNITVRVEPMLRIQGYRDLLRVRPKVRQIAAEMASMASDVFDPVARYRCCRIERQTDKLLQLAPGVQLHADAFRKFFKDCLAAFSPTCQCDIMSRCQSIFGSSSSDSSVCPEKCFVFFAEATAGIVRGALNGLAPGKVLLRMRQNGV